MSQILKSAKSAFCFLASDWVQAREQMKRVFVELESTCSTLIFCLETFSLPSKLAKAYLNFKIVIQIKDIDEFDGSLTAKIFYFSSHFFRGLYYSISSANGLICKPLAFFGKFYVLNETAKEISKQVKVLQIIGQVVKLIYLISDVLRGKKVIRNTIESILLIALFIFGILVYLKVALPCAVIILGLSLSISASLFHAWERVLLINRHLSFT